MVSLIGSLGYSRTLGGDDCFVGDSSGALADTIGRRKLLIFGAVCMLLEMGVHLSRRLVAAFLLLCFLHSIAYLAVRPKRSEWGG